MKRTELTCVVLPYPQRHDLAIKPLDSRPSWHGRHGWYELTNEVSSNCARCCSLVVATTLCFRGTAQTTSDVPVQTAPTIGASTNLDSNSNDVASLYGTPVVEIIARVNDQVITNADLTRAETQLSQQARQDNWTLDQINSSQKTLLRDLIDQQLLLSKGKQLGITGDTELIKRLDEIRKENHLDSLDDLEKAVEQQGISWEDFKANIRNSVITQQVVRDEVGSKLQLSQADIQKYYQDHLDSFTHQESVSLNEILIPTSENSTSAELAAADAKAKEVEAKLKAGASFTDLAKQYSSGPTAQQGGSLGEFHRGALAKVLEDQTFDLPVGGYRSRFAPGRATFFSRSPRTHPAAPSRYKK